MSSLVVGSDPNRPDRISTTKAGLDGFAKTPTMEIGSFGTIPRPISGQMFPIDGESKAAV
jgi:hypothetical protein